MPATQENVTTERLSATVYAKSWGMGDVPAQTDAEAASGPPCMYGPDSWPAICPTVSPAGLRPL